MGRFTVSDYFCGAGGFSEGFRQQNFKIVFGLDSWQPAIDTFNYNFGLNCEKQDIRFYSESTLRINELPDTDIIIGSPPCVSFSSSNKSGKADKTFGVELIEAFFRIIVVKKFQLKSILKAWFMENVPNSIKYLKNEYTFRDLNLENWAKENNYSPSKVVITLEGNSAVLNSASYGSAQSRKRVFVGEFIVKKKFIIPPITNSNNENLNLKKVLTLSNILQNIPKPNSKKTNHIIVDPLYPSIKLQQNQLSNHFYDTGVYEIEWEGAKHLKVNHPFMGKMSFPENINKPSRTVTATRISTSRESLIYKSEYNRKGNGEFRLPTIREIASIMSFPFTYQFKGSEYTKWRLVGNAVSPSVSRAIAAQVRIIYNLPRINKLRIQKEIAILDNLNTFEEKTFNTPPTKKKHTRFRRHLYKDGNMTVTLSNYNLENKTFDGNWYTSIQLGTGAKHINIMLNDYFFRTIEIDIKEIMGGRKFLEIINNGFSEKLLANCELQKKYESNLLSSELGPISLLNELKNHINNHINNEFLCNVKNLKIIPKECISSNQLCALYGINKISTIANNKLCQ